MRIIGIHQPQYLPWLGLVERAARCDLFVILDSVPYSRNYFYNRNKIKTANGPIWLTIPILAKGRFGQLFTETRIDNSQKWAEKHRKGITCAYSKAPFFDDYAGRLYEMLEKKREFLTDICLDSFRFLLESFCIKTKIARSSELGANGAKEELLIDICKKTGATHYLSGPDGRNYLNISRWTDNGIEVDFQNYIHPVYPQLYGDFTSNMSAIDLLFNCGGESCPIVASGQPEYFSFKKCQGA